MELSDFVQPGYKPTIVIYPSEILTTPTVYCTGSTYQKKLAAQLLLSIMYANRGIGLAANQVGLNASMFVMNPTGDSTKLNSQRICINPQILYYSEKTVKLEEKCLSLPNCSVHCRRAKQVTVKYETPDGKEVTEILDALDARVFQHELAHLNGHTILDFIGIK